jgi:hypothetical protein
MAQPAMWRFALRTAAIAAALTLAGCGWARRTPLPEPREPDPQPDVMQLLRANPAAIFSEQAKAQNIMASEPRRHPEGFGWTACVRASLTNIAGGRMGVRTYMIFIDGGKIGLRRLAEPGDGCEKEKYEKV